MGLEGERKRIIFVTEDSPEDYELIKIALDEINFDGEIKWFKNGLEIIEFLSNKENLKALESSDCLILMDINMPKKNGFETLEFLKSNERLKLIPCILLTTSQSKEDIQKAYELGANSFVTKPFDFDSMIKLMESVRNFWLEKSSLPDFLNKIF